jgi:hypothetical protein
MATRDLSIELTRDVSPYPCLVYSYGWTCPVCTRQTAIVIGEDWQCVGCMIDRSGKPAIVIFGWQIARSPLGHITANRIS